MSCTLVTTAAAPAFTPWHSRMPVFLTVDECGAWLDNSHAIAADDTIFRSELKTTLLLKPLARIVSNARHKDPAAMEGIGAPIELHC